MEQFFLALMGAIGSIITGLSAQETVERMSDEERAQLEEQFGSIDDYISQVDLIQQSGLPNIDAEGIRASFGFGEVNPLAVGGSGIFTPSGGGDAGSGTFLESGGNTFFRFDDLINGNVGGFAVGSDFQPTSGQNQFSGSIEGSPTNPDAFADIFSFIRDNIPDPSSVSGDINFEDLGVNIGDVLSNLNLDLGRGDLQQSLEGQLGAANDVLFNPDGSTRLRTDFTFADFLPSNLQDPDAFRKAERERLFSSEAENISAESVRASRQLQESGILPGSAAFGFETGLAPQIRSEGRIGQGQLDIEEAVQNIIGTNAGFEANARGAAQSANAQNVLGTVGLLNAMSGISVQILDIQERTIANQNISIAGAMNEAGRQELAAAGIEINANHLDIQNEFASFAELRGVTQDQLHQYNALLSLGANLTAQQMGLVTQLLMAKLQAEVSDSSSTVLDSDIWAGAMVSAQGMIQIFQSMNPQGPKSSGFNVSVADVGFGTSGCIAGFGVLITPQGRKTLSMVNEGDEVLASNGAFHEVIAKDYGFDPNPAEVHYILVTDHGNSIIGTAKHVVAGQEMQNWSMGDHITMLNLENAEGLKGTVVYHAIVPYTVSGDLLLEGNLDYVVNGFPVSSVAGRKIDAMMANQIGSE